MWHNSLSVKARVWQKQSPDLQSDSIGFYMIRIFTETYFWIDYSQQE